MKFSFDFKKFETLDEKYYKYAVIGLLGVITLMTLSGLIAFFLSLRGAEQTMVPNIQGMELTTALVKLQEKELYPRLSMRATSDPASRGRVLEQKPAAGSIVKAGRRVSIVIGKVTGDKVENYIGQTLDEVKLKLQAQFSSVRPLVTVKEPPQYVYDKSSAGTVIAQKPLAGTEISGQVELTFIVSRGPEAAKLTVPGMIGLSLDNALRQIEKTGVAFSFEQRPAVGKEKPGTVVSQLPAAGSLVAPNQAVAIVFTSPPQEDGMVSGLIKQTFPEYPYPLKVTVNAKKPDGQTDLIATLQHPGGEFTLPYYVPEGTVVSLTILNREVVKIEAKGPAAP